MELIVSLGIYGVPPVEISRVLRIEATEQYAVGDVRKNGRVVQRDIWRIDSPLSPTVEDFDQHVTAVLALIDAAAWAELVTAFGSFDSQLGCYMRFDARYQVGVNISRENMAKLGALNCALDLDLYPDMEMEEKTRP
jgi:Domain of unknown function (DUF4279)